MFDLLKRAEQKKLQQLLDIVKNLDPREEIVVQKKKNYTWLIVLASVVAVAGIAVCVYKCFFEDKDDFDDYEDEDYEDIDYDEDYEDELDDYEEESVDEEL